jgi:hypothetical protein
MRRRKSWDVKPEPLFRVPISASVNGYIEGVSTRGEPTVKVGDLVKYIVPDDWELHAIDAPIIAKEKALGVIRSINWMLIATNKGAYYAPEAEVYWGINGSTTKHTHDSLEMANAV